MNECCDFLVIGSGIAGLCFAIRASRFGKVIMITKKQDTDSNTNYAQGGIACVLDPQDSFENHIRDTLTTGKDLCNEESVRILVEEGPQRIKELLEWGVNFSKSEKETNPYHLHLGKEGGHSVNRIIHAHDLTGREVEKNLLRQARESKSIRILEHHSAIDLITTHHLCRTQITRNRCYGAYILDDLTRTIFAIQAKVTCLATGGAGKVYLHTTNPDIATGDGIAMAYRSGALIANMEFIQFHPTTLFHEKANSFLISEALRGHGAILRNASGAEFMEKYHPMKSLAPRDIVAQAIDKEMKLSGEPCVFLDIRHSPAEATIKHFPNIYARCKEFGIDITKDLIPVVPAAHYLCGGIKVDTFGRTSIDNLYACGEVSCTGVHGANRLASNSLLEALVYSRRAADFSSEQLQSIKHVPSQSIPSWDDSGTIDNEEWILLAHNFKEIQSIMWDYVGIVRSNIRLHRALRRINLLEKEIDDFYKRTRITAQLLELRNIVTTAKLIVISAIKRKESRGLHYTTDYPEQNNRYWKHDTVISKTALS
ncbi:MAG TPA: L-aspartate oxidase [Chitinispirillaceae bacterium]|nr:L-aspartate oxidase [Chitinispirillaceae bacterium]